MGHFGLFRVLVQPIFIFRFIKVGFTYSNIYIYILIYTTT